MTYTLYFADGNTYSADFEDRDEAVEKGHELATQHNTEFDYAEVIHGCQMFAENWD